MHLGQKLAMHQILDASNNCLPSNPVLFQPGLMILKYGAPIQALVREVYYYLL